jgi:cytochrome c-type biogenesis protein CcmH/NrfG
VVPGEPGAWSALAAVYAQNNEFQQAHDSYRHSFELARTPQALAGLGTADLELKNYKECGQVFGAIDRNAQPFMKANPQLLFVYAKCSAETGDRDTARNAYSRFKTYVKPGSPLAKQVDQAIASLGPTPKSTGKPTAKASPKPQSSAKPSH